VDDGPAADAAARENGLLEVAVSRLDRSAIDLQGSRQISRGRKARAFGQAPRGDPPLKRRRELARKRLARGPVEVYVTRPTQLA
jgi:hypothetical protein